MYRESGYTIEEARKLRYKNIIDVDGIRIDKNTNKIVKGRSLDSNYNRRLRGVDINETTTRLRKVAEDPDINTSVFQSHGWLAHNKLKSNKGYKREYAEVVRTIRRKTPLEKVDANGNVIKSYMTNDQAWYFAYFMIRRKYSYERTCNELLSSREFEIYEQQKRARKSK
jgi:hypothetical protein